MKPPPGTSACRRRSQRRQKEEPCHPTTARLPRHSTASPPCSARSRRTTPPSRAFRNEYWNNHDARHLRRRRLGRAAVRLDRQVRQPARAGRASPSRSSRTHRHERGRASLWMIAHRGALGARRQPPRPRLRRRARAMPAACATASTPPRCDSSPRRPRGRGLRAVPRLFDATTDRWHRTNDAGATTSPGTETAVLAGGCFWGMQDLIRTQPGVVSTRVGYSGGDVPNATYRNHGTTPRRSRSCSTRRRPATAQLLEFFFQIHDPTTQNRQGNDIGTSYRSAIFYPTTTSRSASRATRSPTSTPPACGRARS